MLRARPTIALLAGLTVFAVGCGDGSRESVDFTGTDVQVAEVVDDLQDAAESEETTRICRALVTEELASGDCRVKVQQAIDDTDQFALDVRDVRVTGATAVARVITGSGDAERTATMRFARQGSSWRVSAFE
ncbi:MAG: hypothetical protein ACSLFR_07280 [Solirubrobacteraceae bacterium]